LINKQYPHDISFFFAWQTYDIFSLRIPCHNCVVIPSVIVINNHVWTNLFASFTFVLIIRHGCLCINKVEIIITSTFGIIRTTQIAWRNENFLPNVLHWLPPTIWIIHVKEKKSKF
jgi:hypothetical protein